MTAKLATVPRSRPRRDRYSWYTKLEMIWAAVTVILCFTVPTTLLDPPPALIAPIATLVALGLLFLLVRIIAFIAEISDAQQKVEHS